MSSYNLASNNDYLDHLDAIGVEDAAGLRKVQECYGNSWKQRGGVGAFMMLARKWDRIEKKLSEARLSVDEDGTNVSQYDIFEHMRHDERTEGLIDDIRDLRRYLMLIEAEGRAQDMPCMHGVHRDNQQGQQA